MKTSLIALTWALALPASAAVIQFDLQGIGGPGLLGANERPGPVTGGGSGGEIPGGISFDNISKVLTINVGWGSSRGFTDLTGDATGAHLHGPASQTGSAGVLQALSIADNSAANGLISTTLTLTPVQEQSLLDGLTYLNIHTPANGGGEIRGNLVAVPEPGTLALGFLGGLGIFRRRRSARSIRIAA